MMKEALTLWEFGCVRHTGRGRNSNGDLVKFYKDWQPVTVKDAFFSASNAGQIYDFNMLESVAQDCADYCNYFKKLQADVCNMYFGLKPAEETPAADPTWWRPRPKDSIRKRIFNELMFQSPHLIPFLGEIPFTFDKRCLSETYIYCADRRSDDVVLSSVCTTFSDESGMHCDIFDHALPCIGCYTAAPALVFSPYRSMRELGAMPELKAFSSYLASVFNKTPYAVSVKVIPSIYLARNYREGNDPKEWIKLSGPWATALDGDFYGSVAVALHRKCIDDETYGWSFFYWLLKSESRVAREYRKDALTYLSNAALAEVNRRGAAGLPHAPIPQNASGIVDYCSSWLRGLKKAIKDEYHLYKNEIFNARSDGSDAYEKPLPKRAGTIRQLMWKSLPHTCSRCGKRIESIRDMHVDHIIPLAKGGADTVDNMQLLHKACNLSKGAKLPIQDGEA